MRSKKLRRNLHAHQIEGKECESLVEIKLAFGRHVFDALDELVDASGDKGLVATQGCRTESCGREKKSQT
jgi:hypothetical protein